VGRAPVYIPDLCIFSVFPDLASPGTLWKKVRIFPAHSSPAVSRIEENPVRITSLHWLKKYKGAKAPLLVSFLYHGVR